MQYAIDEINDAGGIDGHPLSRYCGWCRLQSLFSEDKELILKDKVISIFGCYTSASRKAIAPTVMKYNNRCSSTCYEGAECTKIL